jgi:putative protease
VNKPEIMSPAGYWPQLQAAIEAGADSVYFGLKHFTARAKVGFTLAELPEVFRTLHRRGVKGFITFNTLIFEHELPEAARAIARIAEAGADALIIQDVTAMQLARRIAPDLELHASTQMSVTNAEGVRAAQNLGATRVTLARELSLGEVRAIRAATDCELEIFVHGALCVAYSGQCFSSEAWGGRSANRGQCAQACRLPYEMIVDGRLRPLADARYLLSPGDLYTLRHIPEIVEIGISALKIEGRYKDADYVALTTAAYRKAVDEAWAGRPLTITPAEELQLEQVYSRGLGAHFVTGTNHQSVVRGRSPRHRGVLAGRVLRVDRDSVVVAPGEAHSIGPLKAGDGVVFDAASWRSPQEPEEGGRVYSCIDDAANVRLRFGAGCLDFSRIRPGDLVWRTHDPDIDAEARKFIDPSAPVARQKVRVRVQAFEGSPLLAEWSLERHPQIAVTVQSPEPLVRANNSNVTGDLVRKQFDRLGNTPYSLGDVELHVTGNPFVPASLLNRLRREAVERLADRQATPTPTITADPEVELSALRAAPSRSLGEQRPSMHLLVRTPAQLDAALDVAPASITLDYLDLYGLKPSVDRVRATGIECRVASPRVLKPGEERIVDFLLRLECPILVRSMGLLERLRRENHPPLTADFSLNVANSPAAATLLAMGLDRLTPGYDLNAAQVAELASAIGGHAIEAVAYQHLPVFHTEHCVFCRFLSTGTSYKDCGRPCESHSVELRDPTGRSHPVIADVGCRNTVFGAEAQQASLHLESWFDAGIRHFRLEFAHESGEQVRRAAQAFASALGGQLPWTRLASIWEGLAPQGTTQGSFFVARDYRELTVLA